MSLFLVGSSGVSYVKQDGSVPDAGLPTRQIPAARGSLSPCSPGAPCTHVAGSFLRRLLARVAHRACVVATALSLAISSIIPNPCYVPRNAYALAGFDDVIVATAVFGTLAALGVNYLAMSQSQRTSIYNSVFDSSAGTIFGIPRADWLPAIDVSGFLRLSDVSSTPYEGVASWYSHAASEGLLGPLNSGSAFTVSSVPFSFANAVPSTHTELYNTAVAWFNSEYDEPSFTWFALIFAGAPYLYCIKTFPNVVGSASASYVYEISVDSSYVTVPASFRFTSGQQEGSATSAQSLRLNRVSSAVLGVYSSVYNRTTYRNHYTYSGSSFYPTFGVDGLSNVNDPVAETVAALGSGTITPTVAAPELADALGDAVVAPVPSEVPSDVPVDYPYYVWTPADDVSFEDWAAQHVEGGGEVDPPAPEVGLPDILGILGQILAALNPLSLLSDIWTALTVTIPQSLSSGWEIVTGIPSAIVQGITNGVSTVVTAVNALGTLITDVPTAINGAISSAVSALEAALSALGISGLIELVRQILAGVLSIPAAIASALGLDFAIDWADDLRPRLPEGPSSLVLPVATWAELVSVSTSLVALTPLGPLEDAINAAFSVMGGSGSAPRAPKYLIEFPKPGGGSWDFWVDFGEIPGSFFVVSHGVFYFVFAVWYVGFVRRFFKLADDLAMRVYGFATGGD